MDGFAALEALGGFSPEQFIPHAPEAKQKTFLKSQAREALYGGAAGGGKSDALLMGALEYVHVPGYAALLLRRTIPQLTKADGLIERSKDWLNKTPAKWNEQKKFWTFPSGARLEFGHMQYEDDKFNYQGPAYQYIGFDELTQFTRTQYLYLMSRLRRLVNVHVPLRVRSATNPGGIGHDWVKERFVDEETRKDRVFVPALLQDNPHLDQDSYLENLALLDSLTRMQLEKGLWVRGTHGLVHPYGEKNILDAVPDIQNMRFGLAVDFGASEIKPTTSFCVLAQPHKGRLVVAVECWKESGMIVSDIARITRETEQRYGDFEFLIGDQGALGKGYIRELNRRFSLPFTEVQKKNKLGYRKLLNDAIKSVELQIVAPTCKPLLKEMDNLPWNDRGTDSETGFENHCTDALLYGWRRCTAYLNDDPAAPKPKVGSQEWGKEMEDLWEQQDVEDVKRLQDLPWWDPDYTH